MCQLQVPPPAAADEDRSRHAGTNWQQQLQRPDVPDRGRRGVLQQHGLRQFQQFQRRGISARRDAVAHQLGHDQQPTALDGNFLVYGASPLTLAGSATLTGNRTVTVLSPSETLTVSGVIGESVFGSQGITKAGRGTLALTNAETYSGTTTLSTDGGTLDLTGSGSLVNSQAFTISQGGTLVLDDSSTTVAIASTAFTA